MFLFNMDTENTDGVASENEAVENLPSQAEETPSEVPETAETQTETVTENVESPEAPVKNGEPTQQSEDAETKPLSAAEATTKAVREILSSKAMTVSTVAYTLTVVAGVVVSFLMQTVANGFFHDMAALGNSLNTGYTFSPVALRFDVITPILSAIAPIILLASLWHIFCQGRKNDGIRFRTGGVTVLQVFSIIGIVLSGIFVVLYGLFFIFATFGGLSMVMRAPDKIGIMVMSVAMGFVSLLLLLVVLYYAMILHSVSSFKKAIITDTPSARGSAYVGVVQILAGVLNIFSFLMISVFGIAAFAGLAVSGFGISAYLPASLLFTLITVSSAVSNIGFGMLMLRYKKSMKRIKKDFKK